MILTNCAVVVLLDADCSKRWIVWSDREGEAGIGYQSGIRFHMSQAIHFVAVQTLIPHLGQS